jgi:hypothetical protein
MPRMHLDSCLQFGFARQITVGQAGKRPPRGADPSEALAPEPSSTIADDTPLALGQVRWCGGWLNAAAADTAGCCAGAVCELFFL